MKKEKKVLIGIFLVIVTVASLVFFMYLEYRSINNPPNPENKEKIKMQQRIQESSYNMRNLSIEENNEIHFSVENNGNERLNLTELGKVVVKTDNAILKEELEGNCDIGILPPGKNGNCKANFFGNLSGNVEIREIGFKVGRATKSLVKCENTSCR